MPLPPGYEVYLNEHGDWTLLPPADVTIFSVPGEGVLLFDAVDKSSATRDALAYLACV